MIFLAWMLLAAVPAPLKLGDPVYQIPADDWRYVEVGLRQRAATVEARYEVERGSREVRLSLLSREDLRSLRRGEPHDVLTTTSADASGRLIYDVPKPGDYVILVENRGDAPSTVRLHVWLDFSGRHHTQVTQLSPRRQLTVVLISFAVFFAIVTYSARRLLHVFRRKT